MSKIAMICFFFFKKRDQESQKLRFHDQLSNLQVRVEELQLKITQLSTENRQIRKEKLLKDQQLKDIQAMVSKKYLFLTIMIKIKTRISFSGEIKSGRT